MHQPEIYLLFKIMGLATASGLLYQDGHLYLIADDSTYLYKCSVSDGSLDRIPLFTHSSEKIPKADKPDFESIVAVGDNICIYGSGSTVNRNKVVVYNSKNHRSEIQDYSGVYERIRRTTGIAAEEFNIEGIVHYKDSLLLFQRGNGQAGINGVFTVTASGDISFISIILPQSGNVHTTFTDAVLVDDAIYFTAAAENSSSTYHDGVIMGSFLGKLNAADLSLSYCELVSATHKFEGLTLYKRQHDSLTFLLCEDADGHDGNSGIYEVTVPL